MNRICLIISLTEIDNNYTKVLFIFHCNYANWLLAAHYYYVAPTRMSTGKFITTCRELRWEWTFMQVIYFGHLLSASENSQKCSLTRFPGAVKHHNYHLSSSYKCLYLLVLGYIRIIYIRIYLSLSHSPSWNFSSC